MNKILARSLLKFTTEELWEILSDEFTLIFDDGELDTTYKHTLFSSHVWDYHRKYPNVPLLKSHHLTYIIGNKHIGSSSSNKLIQNVYWSVAREYNLTTPADRDKLTKMVYEVTNSIYNDLMIKTEAYVTTIDSMDILEVLNHPEIYKATVTDIKPEPASIKNAYQVIEKVLKEDPSMDNNNLASAVKSNRVKFNQVLQCIGPRGRVSEVDNAIFNKIITRGYGRGMWTASDAVLESRTNAKALHYSEAPLEDSEYFSRRLQLVTMTVENIHYGDCGSQVYMDWRVRGKYQRPDNTVYDGDLEHLVGKYYIEEGSDELKVISISDTHLIDKNIRLRTVLGCQHHDRHSVCSTCFGDLSQNLNPKASLGHNSSASMNRQITQNTLGVKHIAFDSTSDPIVLDETSKCYFTTDRDQMKYFVKREVVKSGAMFMIRKEEAPGLTDIMLVSDFRKLATTRTTCLKSVTFMYEDNILTKMEVGKKLRAANLTTEFLSYVKKNGWVIYDNEYYCIDIKDWNFKLPIMEMPAFEVSFAEHGKWIASYIESNKEDYKKIKTGESGFTKVINLFDIVNAKLKVNLALLEVIVYSYMVNNSDERDFDLTRRSYSDSVGNRNDIIAGRSLAAAYAFERQDTIIYNPESFFHADKRPDSPMDVYFCPDEVVKAHKE